MKDQDTIILEQIYLEEIQYKTREIILDENDTLYHGTGESFDSREIRAGFYDNIFWTVDNIVIARSYIPRMGGSLYTTTGNILKDEKLSKSLGITEAVRNKAWDIHNKLANELIHWRKIADEYNSKFKQIEKDKKQYESDLGDFFKEWHEAEDNKIEAREKYRTVEEILFPLVNKRMQQRFGYVPEEGKLLDKKWAKVYRDYDGNILPADSYQKGRVFEVTPKRKMKIYNYAKGREPDLTNIDYHKHELFKTIEEKGYDGIVITDFAQTEVHGNFGHLSIGFFPHALKDLNIKVLRDQTHPSKEDFGL